VRSLRYRRNLVAFRSIRGVADRTVARVMAEMPEIGTLPHKTISKLAGLAPLANDSGKHHGKRAVRGGRSSVREILFLVAGVAARYEPDFIAFKQRLANQENHPKSSASPGPQTPHTTQRKGKRHPNPNQIPPNPNQHPLTSKTVAARSSG